MTFYGYEVIQTEIDRGRGHRHRCGKPADSLNRRTLEYVRWLSLVRFSWQICPVSGFCPDSLSGVCLSGYCLSRFCPLSGFCPEFRKKRCPVSVCPDSVCLNSVRRPDSVRNFAKNPFRCLSVRPDKDETELSGLSLSLSADVCPRSSQKKFHLGESYIKLTLWHIFKHCLQWKHSIKRLTTLLFEN